MKQIDAAAIALSRVGRDHLTVRQVFHGNRSPQYSGVQLAGNREH